MSHFGGAGVQYSFRVLSFTDIFLAFIASVVDSCKKRIKVREMMLVAQMYKRVF